MMSPSSIQIRNAGHDPTRSVEASISLRKIVGARCHSSVRNVLRTFRPRPQRAKIKYLKERGGVTEPAVASLLRSENRADLNVEIGVMLRGGPDGKDQVPRIKIGDLSVANPVFHGGRFLVHQGFQLAFEH